MFRKRRPARTIPDNAPSLLYTHVADWRVLTEPERHLLVDRAEYFLDSWTWEAARNFELTDSMCLIIAANAAVMTLGFDDVPFANVRSIVVHPSTLVSNGPRPGPIQGLMTDEPNYLAGEAHQLRGPLLLSWKAIRRETMQHGSGLNVVVHEFAHKLDMGDGLIDGTPPMNDTARLRWIDVCTTELRQIQSGIGDHLLRDYAATNPGEFFAVASEAFFDQSLLLQVRHDRLYTVLAEFYRQDPASRQARIQPDGGLS